MAGLDPSAWESFALGQLGASAALLGLVFVGISINLRQVVSSPLLVNRAGEAVLLLGGLLIGSTFILIPDQSSAALGVEMLGLGLALLGGVAYLQRGIHVSTRADVPEVAGPAVSVVVRRVLGLGSGVLVLVASATLLADAGGGLYWWAAAVVVSYLGALSDGWVLLIEILR